MADGDFRGTTLEDWEAMEVRWAECEQRRKQVAMSMTLQELYLSALEDSEAALTEALEHAIRCREQVQAVSAVLEARMKGLDDE